MWYKMRRNYKLLNDQGALVFHGTGGYSKHNCLQDRFNFHSSRAWDIVLIFNTDIDRSWYLSWRRLHSHLNVILPKFSK